MSLQKEQAVTLRRLQRLVVSSICWFADGVVSGVVEDGPSAEPLVFKAFCTTSLSQLLRISGYAV